jgi:hypothetical protein
MNELILAMFLLAPIVSKNPVAQDTIAAANIHLTAGVRPGNYIIGEGVEGGLKFEYLLFHPIILRASADYSHSNMESFRYPDGKIQSLDVSTEAILYRGTKKLTAYLGGGVVYSFNHFDLKKQLEDSLFTNSGIYNTDIENKYGYRLTMGFRFREHYSLEFGYQESRPNFMFHGVSTAGKRVIIYKESKLSVVRFTVGYLFSL